jgi:hypothetical protein
LGVTDIEEIESIKEEVNFGLPQELVRESNGLETARLSSNVSPVASAA